MTSSAASTTATEPSAPRGNARLLTALVLASALSPLGSTMIAVALPGIGQDFGVEAGTLTQWLVTSYLLVSIVCQSPFGKLGDLIGHTRALALGQVVCAVGIAFGAFAPHVSFLVIARILVAAAGAAMVPAAMALLRNRTAPDKRTRAFAVMGSAMGLAAASGPLLGGELVARFGWRAIFLANVPLLVGSALLARGERSEGAATRPRFDALGSVLLGAALTALVLGAKANGPIRLACIATFAVLLAIFIVWERRTAHPVIDLGVFRIRAFSAGATVIALQNLAMYALLFQLPHFFIDLRGSKPSHVGRALLAMTLSMVLCAFIAARMSERFGPRLTVALGALISLGGVLLIDLRAATTPQSVLVPLALLGVGLGLSTAPSQAAAMEPIAPLQSGMAAGTMSTLRYIGGIFGSALLALVLTAREQAQLIEQNQMITKVYAASLALSFVVALALPARPVRTRR